MTVAISDYALVELAEVRLFLGMEDGENTERNDTIQRAINGISIAIARRAQRQFVVPEAFQSASVPRWARISESDVARGYVRVGDMKGAPTEVAILSPDRNGDGDPNVLSSDGGYWLEPDVPEPGMPYESINIISTVGPLTPGWWLRVKSVNWGFESVPEDIVLATTACVAAWVLNDPMKQSEMAAETGKRVTIADAILPEWEDTIDEYRIYRVS